MRISTIMAGIFALLAVACSKTSTTTDTASASDVSDAVESHITTINNATSDVSTGNSTVISQLSPGELKIINEGTLWQKITNFAAETFDSSLGAVTFTCNSGSVSDNASPAFGSASSLTVTRTWSNCIGDGGAFKRNGVVNLGWAGLNTTTPFVQAGATLKRATSSLTMTRVSTGNYVEISGNDSANAVSGSNANQTFSWSSVSGSSRTFTLNINETRQGKTSGGTTLFRHNITTPTALSITTDTSASTRTISSGSVAVEHAIAGFTVTTTFSNAVWDTSTCKPKSGSATISVSGKKSGSGTVTFSSDGTVNFTYEGATGSITVAGC